ncbi:hypothetical protein [Streptomyces sp. NPDC051567]|uniref:hypothetical protein n=1 Tax=Streptomyces sp. NPDC051567 TaxID=3365660 RepID=UPI00378E3F04
MTAININDHHTLPTAKPSGLTLSQVQRGLAFHEAAHAVVGMYIGMSCERVSVHRLTRDGRSGWSGVTTWAHCAPVSEFGFAVQAAAGGAADRRQLAAAGLLTAVTLDSCDASHDRDTAVSVLAAAGYTVVLQGAAPGYGCTWTEVEEATEATLDDLWEEITAVALALLATGDLTLTGAQVSAAAGIPNPTPAPLPTTT